MMTLAFKLKIGLYLGLFLGIHLAMIWFVNT
jgi:hypothetical protein